MRTRIFSTPNSGTPTVAWQPGNATAGVTGSLLPFTTGNGQPAGSGGSLSGPGTFVSAQFSLAAAPSTLYVALDTNGAASGVGITLESYSNFAWTVLDASNLAATTAAANLPAANQLTLLRVRVTVSGNASAQCVAILNTTSAPAGGGGTSPVTTTTDERIGEVLISAGADHVAVIFDRSFSAVPLSPWCSVQRPTATTDVITFSDVINLTANGFTAVLSAATPADGYLLSYRAVTGTIPTAPPPSAPTLNQPFDFAVLRYQWTEADGTDLDTRTTLVDPEVEGDVGWARQAQVPASGTPGPFLVWGGDNTTPTGAEAVLIDFAAIAAANPSASTVTIRLRANWYSLRADGLINLQFATYLGGTMQPDGTDFVNTGGAAVQTINAARAVTSNVRGDVDGDECGTLVYDVGTHTATIVAPTGTVQTQQVGGVPTNPAQVPRSNATK